MVNSGETKLPSSVTVAMRLPSKYGDATGRVNDDIQFFGRHNKSWRIL